VRLLLALIAILLCPLAQAAPSRVVSLDLCMDWLLAYYATPAQVAALSPMQQRYPVEWIGNHWPAHDGSLEQVYALKPDQVLVGQYAASLLRQRLVELGITVEVLPLPQTLEQVQDYERQFLHAIGLPPSRASAIPAQKPVRSDKRLLLLGANGIGTGTDTLEDAILTRAGWRNYLQTPGYQSLDLEQVVSDPPDAILWAAPEHKALANQFAEHAALRRAVPAAHWLSSDYWRWQCPGPWTWELIGQLQQWLD
jgi:iron complex transport system substrate-binding protein